MQHDIVYKKYIIDTSQSGMQCFSSISTFIIRRISYIMRHIWTKSVYVNAPDMTVVSVINRHHSAH